MFVKLNLNINRYATLKSIGAKKREEVRDDKLNKKVYICHPIEVLIGELIYLMIHTYSYEHNKDKELIVSAMLF